MGKTARFENLRVEPPCSVLVIGIEVSSVRRRGHPDQTKRGLVKYNTYMHKSHNLSDGTNSEAKMVPHWRIRSTILLLGPTHTQRFICTWPEWQLLLLP